MRPMMSCLSERKRNVRDLQSPASCVSCKLVFAFPNDMFASKVYKDVLAGPGESLRACWCAASKSIKSLNLGWGEVMKVGGNKNFVHCFVFLKTNDKSSVPITINHYTDYKNTTHISGIL